MVCRSLRSPGSRCIVLAMVLLGLAGRLPAQQSAPFVYAYDEAGRLVGMVDAAGNTTTYTYDALGNILSIVRGNAAVSILEFSPNSGPVGASVTITGAGFSATVANNAVTFNGVSATVLSATPNRLVAVVPAGATTGPIRVTSPAGNAVSATSFTVGPMTAPSISGFTPMIGTAGSAVTITGTNFETVTGSNKVAFNGRLGTVSSATATTLGVAVPSSATSGRITVTTPNGRATSSGDFFVPPPPYTAADVELTGRMTIGETRNVTISVANKIGLIVFDGSAGQRIALSVSLGTGLAGGGCDAVSIRRPDGAYLVSSAPVCGSSGFIDQQVLPVGGTYLIAFDPAGTESGTATLTLYDASDAAATIVPGGLPVTITTTIPGQNGALTFAGTAGHRVSLNVSFGSGLYPGLCNSVSIQNPNGTALLNPTTTCGSSYFSDALTLSVTGNYTISMNPSGMSVGSATLTLYDVPPDATASLLPGGSPGTVTTTAPGQNAQVSFSGAAGQRVSLNVSFGSGFNSLSCSSVSIQNPDGTALLSPTTTCGLWYFSDVRVLPATGVYMITVNPLGLDVGSATLSLYDVPLDATASLVPGGSSGTVTTTAPGQNAQVSFSGAAGQRVSLNVSFGSGFNSLSCSSVSIQNPDGTVLLSPTTTCGLWYFSDVRILPATGVYMITVNPLGLDVGSATLALYDVPADVAAWTTVGGSAATVTTTVPGQNATVTFGGLAGQQVTVWITGNTTGLVTVTLWKPDGSTQTSSSSSAASFNLATQTLPVAGTYTIFINPSVTSTGSINASATSP